MAQIEIPEKWRKDVCAVLATEAKEKIEWKVDAEIRYEADATAAKLRQGDSDPVWRYEVYQPLIDFLSSPNPKGCLITMERRQERRMSFSFDSWAKVFTARFCFARTAKGWWCFRRIVRLKLNFRASEEMPRYVK